MKAKIRGLSIAGMVLSSILGLGLFIAGMVFIAGAESLLKEILKDPEVAKAWSDAGLLSIDGVKSVGLYLLIPGIFLLVGVVIGVLMLVLVAIEKPNKVAAIIIGILGIACGEIFITVAGILSIVYGVKANSVAKAA